MGIRNLHLYISAAALFTTLKGVTPGHCPGYSCTNWNCIPNNALCNMIRDCLDGSDEDGCHEEGDLQLVDQSGSVGGSAGRLEIYLNSAWGTVCHDNFGGSEADIACKELGYLYSSRVGNVTKLGYSQGSGSILLDNVHCSTFDSRLVYCERASSSEINCGHSKDVAVECTSQASPVRLVSESGRTANLSAGRLEIYFNGQWGTVCDDSFSIAEAKVACRQMGFERANSYSSTLNIGYGIVPSSTPTWLDNLDCFSSSTNNNDLRLCSHAGVGNQDCNHNEDIILSCTSPGLIRLVSSDSTSTSFQKSGRLEIYWNGAWGTVCNEPSFSYINAQVACRQLGLEYVSRYSTLSDLGFSLSYARNVLLDGISCSSSSTSTLLDCSHNTLGSVSSSCGYFDDVGLICSPLGNSNNESSTTREGGIGSHNIGRVISGACLLVIASIFYCIMCVAIVHYLKKKRNVRQQNRSNFRETADVPSTITTPATTTGGGTVAYPIQQSQDYPVQPLCTFLQAANLPEQGGAAYPPSIPANLSWQVAPPPSYESAASYPIGPTPPGRGRTPPASYPVQGQTPYAPYPVQGQAPVSQRPVQGQIPFSQLPRGQGQLPFAQYPTQGQSSRPQYLDQGQPPPQYPDQGQPPPQYHAQYPDQGQTPHAQYPDHGQPPHAQYPDQGQPPHAQYPDHGQPPHAQYHDQGQPPHAQYPDHGQPPHAQYPDQGQLSHAQYPNQGPSAPSSGVHDGSVISTNESEGVVFPSAPSL